MFAGSIAAEIDEDISKYPVGYYFDFYVLLNYLNHNNLKNFCLSLLILGFWLGFHN